MVSNHQPAIFVLVEDPNQSILLFSSNFLPMLTPEVAVAVASSFVQKPLPENFVV